MAKIARSIKNFIKSILHFFFEQLNYLIPGVSKIEQFLYEFRIECMHKHTGYAAFSKILRSFIPPKAKVLDLGCNKGFETKIITETNHRAVGVDVYKSFVKIARKRGVEAQVMDFHNLTFFEEFDCVYSNNTLEHATEPEKVVRGVYKALKPGGIFIIGMPLDGNNLLIKDPAHFYRTKENDVVELLKQNNFRIIHKEIIDTKRRWDWENPPCDNKMLICVAQKLKI